MRPAPSAARTRVIFSGVTYLWVRDPSDDYESTDGHWQIER